MEFVMNIRPHPDPLPRGAGTATHVSSKFVRRGFNRRASTLRSVTQNNLISSEHARDRRMFLPLPGERAGVRAVVTFLN